MYASYENLLKNIVQYCSGCHILTGIGGSIIYFIICWGSFANEELDSRN